MTTTVLYCLRCAVHRAFLLVLFFSFLSICRAAHGVETSEAFLKSVTEQEHHRCAPPHAAQFSAWSVPTNLGPVVNSKYDDHHPAISNDGLTLYITSTRPGGFSAAEDIWVSQRKGSSEPWKEPQHLGPNINSPGGTCCPNLTPDEHWLYFSGRRAEGLGGSNLWVSHRENTKDPFGWETPSNLGAAVHSTVGLGECAPTYFNDEQTGIVSLYFCRDKAALGDFNIYVSMLRLDNSFGRPALVWELNTPHRNTRTAIRRDGLEMFITSNRPGGFGSTDLWVSTRETTLDAWSSPVNLGSTINTMAMEGGPALSCDGTTLYFTSDRPGGSGGRDLYVTTRQRTSAPGDD
jgi:hypothetical protein